MHVNPVTPCLSLQSNVFILDMLINVISQEIVRFSEPDLKS